VYADGGRVRAKRDLGEVTVPSVAGCREGAPVFEKEILKSHVSR
jgi:hypothetical protein